MILGLQGSGKTTLLQRLVTDQRHIILDPLGEHTDYNSKQILPSEFFKLIKPFGRAIVGFDEASRYLGKGNIKQDALDYFDSHRHFHQTPVVIARRPSQLHSDIIDLATKIIVFNLPGANDRSVLESIAPSLGEQARAVKGHEYIWTDEGRAVHVEPFI